MVIVSRRGSENRVQGSKAGWEILLTSSSSMGNSATQDGRLFGQENKIITDNIFDIPKLMKRLQSNLPDVQYIIAVDDIIGSGESVIREVRRLAAEADSIPNIKNVKWFYISVCGFDDSTRLLEEA